MKKTALVVAIGTILSACGGSTNVGKIQGPNSSSPETFEIGAAIDETNETSPIEIGAAIDATNETSPLEISATIDATNETSPLEIGAAIDATPEASITIDENQTTTAADSKSLSVSNSFSFATARTVDVDFDLEQARNQVASVSICTSFDPLGGAFDVDYDSCTVQGQMVNGVFHHSMEVTNDIESVAGVVWFQDNSIPPLMQVFSVAHTSSHATRDRTVLSIGTGPKIVWR